MALIPARPLPRKRRREDEEEEPRGRLETALLEAGRMAGQRTGLAPRAPEMLAAATETTPGLAPRAEAGGGGGPAGASAAAALRALMAGGPAGGPGLLGGPMPPLDTLWRGGQLLFGGGSVLPALTAADVDVLMASLAGESPEFLAELAASGVDYLPWIGAAVGVGLGAWNLAEGNIAEGAGGLGGAAVGAGIGALVGGPYGALIGAGLGAGLGGFAGGMFGKDEGLTHEQREAREVQRVGGTARGFAQELAGARDEGGLWNTLVRWQSGYVGGTSPVAVAVQFPQNIGEEAIKELVKQGHIILPGGATGPEAVDQVAEAWAKVGWRPGDLSPVFPGTTSDLYPVWSREGFFAYLREHPGDLVANTQAGVTPGRLDLVNQGITQTILAAASRFGGFGGEGAFAGMPPLTPSFLLALREPRAQLIARQLYPQLGAALA